MTVDDAAKNGILGVLKLLHSNRAHIHQENSNGTNCIMSASLGTGDCKTVTWLIQQGVDVNHCNKDGWTVVHWAAQKGYLDVLKLLHSNGANIHQETSDGTNCIMSASFGTGDCKTVTWLIQQGVDVNHCNKDGWTAVQGAAQKGNLDVLKLLHSNGANIHQETSNGTNCIMSASLGTGDCKTLTWLIQQGVDVNHCNKDGWTAVHWAAQKGYLDVLKLLHSNGANIHQETSDGTNCIMSASFGTGDCKTVTWLIQQGVDVNHCNKDGWTAVHLAAQKGNLGVLKLLHSNGANIHQESSDGTNCIMSASLGTGDSKTLTWLIQQGVDVNHCNKDGCTAVQGAAQKENLDVLKLLHSNGANIHQESSNGTNCIMSASLRTGDCKTVKWLIQQGVDVNYCNKDGWTAVHGAAQKGNLDMLKLLHSTGANIHQETSNGSNCIMSAALGTGDCKTVTWLIQQGVDVNHCNKDGWTAVHWAAHEGNLDVLKLLHSNGANIHQESSDGSNCIMSASLGTGDSKTVTWLIQQGVDVNHCNKDGWTAVHGAAHEGNLDVLKLLHSNGANIHQETSDGTNCIMSASLGTGDCKTLTWLTQQGVDVNHCNKDGWTAVQGAAQKGNLDVLKLLHSNAANIHQETSNSTNCIMSASLGTGDCKTLTWLIQQGVDVNHCNKDGWTAVHWAAQKGYLDVLKLLHSNGANIHQETSDDTNCIMSASLGTGDCKTVTWLIQQGVDVNHCNKDGCTAVHGATLEGNLDVLKLLHSNGANIHQETSDDTNCIMSASLGTGDCKTVTWLIQQGVDVNHCNKDGWTAVHWAAQKGYLDVLKLLHSNGANIHQETSDDTNCIMSASLGTGDCKTVTWLIQQGVDVNHCNKDGWTAVHWAAQKGYLDVLKLLHSNGANIHQETSDDTNCIMSASLGTGDCITLTWLIQQGVDVNHCNKDGWTAVHWAAQKAYLDVLKLLHSNGANIHQETSDDTNCIMSASLGTGDCKTVTWLIQQGVDVNHCNKDGCTAVHGATLEGNLDVLKLLHSNGANIHQETSNGTNCIMSASLGTGDSKTVAWLIQQGVDVNHCNKDGWTAVHWAAQKGYLDVLKLLHSNGANIHQETSDGTNCIMSASFGTGDCKTVTWLIQQGVDVNQCNKDGWTAVHLAAQKGNLGVLKLLHSNGANIHQETSDGTNCIMSASLGTGDSKTLTWLKQQGVDVNHCNKDGCTAVHGAAHEGNLDVLKLLHSNGANIHQETSNGSNCIMSASLGTGDCKTVTWLIQQGVDVNHCNKDGWTAVHWAAQKGNLVVLKLLHSNGANIHQESSDGTNCIMSASLGTGDCKTVTWLIQQGVDVNYCNKDGCTAVHGAALEGNLDVLKLLHSYGANIHQETSNGTNCIMSASLGTGDSKTVTWLIQQGIDVNHCNKDGCTAVHGTAQKGNVDVLKLLHSNGANIHQETSNGSNCIMSASLGTGDCKTVTWLIQQGVDVNHCNKDGRTAVHGAAQKENLDVLKLLHSNGANIHQETSNGSNCIMSASLGTGDCKTLIWLIQQGVDVNHCNKDGWTAVHWAAQKGNLGVLKLLHSNRANIHQETSNGSNCIMSASLGTGDCKTVTWLIQQGVDVNHCNKDGWTAFHWAAQKGNLDVLKLLHSNGASIHQDMVNGTNCIMSASLGTGDCKTVKWLIQQGVDVNHCNKYGWTAVHGAAGEGNLDVLKLLHSNAANIYQETSNGSNCIMSASLGTGDSKTVTWLIQQGVDVNHCNKDGWTAVHGAAHQGNLDVLKLLHSNGANIHQETSNGTNSILSTSLGTGDCKTVKWLIHQGVDVNHCNKDGCTAVHGAAKKGNLDVLKLLHSIGANIHQESNNGSNCIMSATLGTGDCKTLTWLIQQGVDVNHCNKDGCTAVHGAAHEGNLDVLKLLQSNGANIHQESSDGTNYIMSASLGTGGCKIVTWFIEQGLDVNHCNKDGWTAVHCAAQKGNLDVLKLLHSNGANIHQETGNGSNCIISATLGTGDCKTVTWLIQQGVDVNHCNKDGWTAVHGAAQKGNLDVLKLLQSNGTNIHQESSDGTNCIMSASLGPGDCKIVTWFIEQGVDVNHCNKDGWTAVHCAAQKGNLHVLKLLHSNGANIHQETSNGFNCIMSASLGTGDCKTMKWLIQQGVDVNHCNKDGWTAVQVAAREGNLDVVKLLHSNGANIHQESSHGSNCIMSASLGTGDCKTVTWLIQQGVDVNHCNKDGWTAVHGAAQKGNLDVLKLLHSNGANIHQESSNSTNCIISASLGTGDCKTVTWLIQQGVDVNHCNKDGWTAVHGAAQKENLDVLKLLHSNGANIHQESSDGTNCIMSASLGTGDCKTLTWLIQQGVDVNHCNKDGWTAVQGAAQKGNLDVLKLLQSNGANIHQESSDGTNCIMSASLGTGDCKIVTWFKEQGVDLNHCNKDGWTAVHCAAQKGNLDVLKLLHSNGANIHQESNNGTNCIMSASLGTGDCKTVKWLIQQGVDVNHCNKYGWTAVHGAADEGNLDVLKLLHSNAANIYQETSNGSNCIMSASLGTGDSKTVTWLIQQGVDVNHCNKDGWTAVHGAAHQGNLDVLKLLHSNGANIHQETSNGTNSILSTSLGTGDCKTVKWLIHQGVDVNHCNKDGCTAVHGAAKKGNLDVLKLLHSIGANIHQESNNGSNCIMSATLGTGDCKTLTWLIQQGVDVNHCNKDGCTAVHGAAHEGNLDVLKLLQSNGANIHQESSDGTNYIMSASLGTGGCKIVTWFIEQGLDVNHCNKDGWTAVHCAAQKGNLDVLKLLHSNGANIHQETGNGSNCIISATLGTGDCKTVTWLIQQGVDVNHCNKDGWTAVHGAAQKGNLDVLKLLQSNGTNIHQESSDGTNCIMSASLGPGDCKIVTWFIEQGVDVNHCNKDGWTAVHCAAQKGNLHVLKLLHSNGANIHQETSNGFNCIMSASLGTGDCKTMKWLIQQGVDVNHCNKDGWTAVQVAAREGNLDVVKLLHSNGANIHQESSHGSNCIMSASLGTGDCKTVTWLIQQGVDVNHCNKDGWTAVHGAAQKGNLDVLKLLHSNGANIHQESSNSTNCIISASLGTGDCKTVTWLIQQGVDVNHCNKDGWTAVHGAAQKENLDVLKLLHSNGANIHQESSDGTNCIMSASLGTGDCKTLTWLIQQGVDVNHCNKDGWTAVQGAAQKGNLDVLKLLQSNGANIHQESSDGTNCIMSASLGTGDCKIVTWFKEQGVDLNHCNKDGWTAVHCAAQKGNLDVLKLLHSNGANIHQESNNGTNCIMSASLGTGDCKTVKWLIQQGVDVNHCNKYGWTAVHGAADEGNLDVLKLLHSNAANIYQETSNGSNCIMSASLGTGDSKTVTWLIQQGVDVNHCNKDGWTAVHGAAHQGNLDVLKLLHSNGANIHQETSNGTNSILSTSLGTGDCKTVKWLIHQGVDVNHCNKDGCTAVHGAAKKGNLDVLKLLHSIGANIHQESNNGSNCIMSATLGTGDCKTLTWLIQQGVDVNHCNKDGCTAVHGAAHEGNLDVLKLLQSNGANIHQESSDGTNYIMSASLGTGGCKIVTWFIEQGLDVNHCNKDGWTAVHGAAQKGNLDVLKLLHSNGANIHLESSGGTNCIMSASLETGDCKTLTWLIQQGVDVNHCNKDGWTAVQGAAHEGNLGVLKLLHSNGANIHQETSDGTNCIMSASLGTGDCKTVTWLIQQGVDVNHCNKDGWTAVHWAAQKGNLDVLKLLHSNGANIHQESSDGTNCIMSASLGTGDCKTLTWLIQQGVDVNHCNKDGWTAVYWAAQKGNLDVLKLLHSNGANIHQESSGGTNCIMSASLGTGDSKTVTWLIQQGVDVNHCNKDGWTAVQVAAQKGNLDVLKLLHSNGANIHQESSNGTSCIISASLGTGDCKTVKWLIHQGVDVNHCNKDGCTAVHGAAQKGNLDVLKLLHSNGANIHQESNNGSNCIMSASLGTGDCKTLTWLIQQGVDVNHCNKDGCTAVHGAAQKENLDVLKLLHSNGANIHQESSDGTNCIMSASLGTGDCKTLTWLIQQGVDVNHCNKDGWTAVHGAAQKECLDVLKLLHSNGANIHQESSDGTNCIMSASLGTGDCKTVTWLIQQGVDVNHCNKDGSTAVHGAAHEGNLDVLKLLHSNGANIHQETSNGTNCIMSASLGTGDCKTVTWLIQQGVDVNHCNKDGWTAVHGAAHEGNLDVLKLLHSDGANIHQETNDGTNCIMSASLGTGDSKTVTWLIEQGVDVNHCNKDGWTAVHGAAHEGNLDMLKLLHSNGANIHQETSDGTNCIMLASLRTGDSKLVTWLMDKGMDVNHCNKYGLAAVYCATYDGNLDVLKLLHSNEGNIHQTLNSFCAFHVAAYFGKVSVLKFLCSVGVKINVQDNHQNNALQFASLGNSTLETIKWLADNKIDVLNLNAEGHSALHYAAGLGQTEIIKYIATLDQRVSLKSRNG